MQKNLRRGVLKVFINFDDTGIKELTNICLQVKWYLFQHQVICKCSACIPGHIALLHPPVDNLVSSATKLSLQSCMFASNS